MPRKIHIVLLTSHSLSEGLRQPSDIYICIVLQRINPIQDDNVCGRVKENFLLAKNKKDCKKSIG